MPETPDLSRIVNMIMENPALIKQISDMARGEDGTPTVADAADEAKAEAVSAAPIPDVREERRIHRSRLASAMKPYLSEGRRQALDTMLGIADILDMTRGRG